MGAPVKNQDSRDKSIVSEQEDQMTALLKKRNLEMTNLKSDTACIVDSFYTRFGKRLLDILILVPVLLLTLPFNLIFAVCTYFDVGRPTLFKQKRTGKNGKPFVMIKFRDMNNKCDAERRLLPAGERVTRFGRFMRKTSCDELLSFWNVLKYLDYRSPSVS